MRDSTLEFLHRHAEVLSVVCAVVAMMTWTVVFVVFALPKSYGEIGAV